MWLVKVIISKHFVYEASCQLTVLLCVAYTFILNILSKFIEQYFHINKRQTILSKWFLYLQVNDLEFFQISYYKRNKRYHYTVNGKMQWICVLLNLMSVIIVNAKYVVAMHLASLLYILVCQMLIIPDL